MNLKTRSHEMREIVLEALKEEKLKLLTLNDEIGDEIALSDSKNNNDIKDEQ